MANKELFARHGLAVNNTVLVANVTTTNVGVGRNDPAYKLDVAGAVNASALLINGVAVGGSMDYAYTNAVGLGANTYAASLTAKVNVSTTGPTGNTQGTLWWNSYLGRLFVYYNDGDSTQWVEASPSGGGSSSTSSGSDPVAYTQANIAYTQANIAYTQANISYTQANTAYDKANSANVLAFNTGIGANNWANTLATAGNNYTLTAYNTANIANAMANNIAIDTEMKGFMDQIETYLRFDTTSNTFTLADSGSGWSYYLNGIRYTKSGNSTVSLGSSLSNGTYYITIQNNGLGTLSFSNTTWNLSDPTTIPVAYVKYNTTATPKYFIAEERHTVLMDSRTHTYLHFTRGTQAHQFGTLSGYSVNGTSNSNNIFSISTTILDDEDIVLTIPADAGAAGQSNNYYVFYRYAANSWSWLQQEMPYKFTTGGFIEYDNNAVMTQAANNVYVNSYLFFTNLDQGAGFAIIPGRGSYANLSSAQSEDAVTFDMTGFGVLESVIAYQLTWRTDSTLTTSGKCQLADSPRKIGTAVASIAPVYTSGLHNDLGGLQGGNGTEYYHLTSTEYTSLAPNANTANLAYNQANSATLIGANAAIEFIIDGGGSAITTGQKGHLEIPFSCTINRWTMMLDQTGSANVEIWKAPYANFPPVAANTINASGFVVSSAVKGQGTTIATTSIAAGDILAYNVATVATATRITISLKVTKS